MDDNHALAGSERRFALPRRSGGELVCLACSAAASGSRMILSASSSVLRIRPARLAARRIRALLASDHMAGTVRHLRLSGHEDTHPSLRVYVSIISGRDLHRHLCAC